MDCLKMLLKWDGIKCLNKNMQIVSKMFNRIIGKKDGHIEKMYCLYYIICSYMGINGEGDVVGEKFYESWSSLFYIVVHEAILHKSFYLLINLRYYF